MEVKPMKKNPRDRYRITEDPMIIEDRDTEKKLLFCIDKKYMIVFRSMLEEDIGCINKMDISFYEINKKKRFLEKVLPRKNSEHFFFIIEKIDPIDYCKDNFQSEEWDWIYGYPRHVIGIGARTDLAIEAKLFKKYEEKEKQKIQSIMRQVALYYGIRGEFYLR